MTVKPTTESCSAIIVVDRDYRRMSNFEHKHMNAVPVHCKPRGYALLMRFRQRQRPVDDAQDPSTSSPPHDAACSHLRVRGVPV